VNRLFLFVLVAGMAGCADLAPVAPGGKFADAAWDARLADLYRLRQWSIHGHLAIQAGGEGWSATLQWDQDNQNYMLRFIAPLGQGTYQLSGDEVKATLLTADNKVYRATDVESLLQDNLGWNIPLHGLQYWVRGAPEPGITTDNLVLDDKGRMTDLQQSGWRINISKYEEFNGKELPSKLLMQNERFQLRLVVLGWKTTS
jgi:outer membrane lipoprotein LolB